ncbi:hypothetical protein E4T49_06696 [Aureobasidium sp. EXF-10728]|nr:hypothetical protein E4T49_06696 [Aureobasidium sp. EXF-10728]
MWNNAILAWTVLLPATWALQIDSHLATSTTLLCSTIYAYSSPSGTIPTATTTLQHTLDLSPVILHNYTSSTVTVTPKPFSTLFSVLATKTKYATAEPVNGTLFVTATKFATSTFWNHETVTKTKTKFRYLTSRTTVLISAPTGFVGVRNGSVVAEDKNDADSKATRPKLVKPTEGRFAVEVACEEQVAIHTTEVLLLRATAKATLTLRPETVFKNRTVYGYITSTVLGSPSASTVLGSLSTSTASSASTVSQAKRQTTPSTALPTPPLELATTASIITNTTTVTKTPYTISFTWTKTDLTTITVTRHATTTVTSHAACATANLLSQTSNNKRINGVTEVSGQQLEVSQTATAAECCELCMQPSKNCFWSIWEAVGTSRKGKCHLVLQAEGTQQGVCQNQIARATFGYSGRNGEVGYVVSNGLCGALSEG